MKDQNSIMITGTVTKDAELKYGASGGAYCKFSVANNYFYDSKNGQKSTFYNIDLFGKQAEKYAPLLMKGDRVAILGQHKIDKFEYNGEQKERNVIFDCEIKVLGKITKKGTDKTNVNHETSDEATSNTDIEFEDDDEFPF